MDYNTADEQTLLQASLKGDKLSRRVLVGRYVPMVHEIINRRGYGTRRINTNTLVSEGLANVLHAVNTYDPTKGAQLKTHVWNNVEHGLGRFVDEHANVARISAGRVKYVGRFQSAEDELRETLGRKPSDDELASHMNATVDTAKRWNAAEVARLRSELRNDYLATDYLSDEDGAGDTLGDVTNTVNTRFTDDVNLRSTLERVVRDYDTPSARAVNALLTGLTDDDVVRRIPGMTQETLNAVRRRLKRDLRPTAGM